MDFDKITKYLDSLVEEKDFPSVDCVIYKDHEMLYRHMKGTNDRDKKIPVRENQQYLMFSMTKVQTMIAFMQLVEEGKISLEDNVSDYLPVYTDLLCESRTGNAINIVKCSGPMKIKHLVSMQSGLDYDLQRAGILRVLSEKGMNATTREIVDSFIETPLKFEPGTHFLYSLSHDVIAAIIEVVSGKSFGDYLKENIWDRLGMNDTLFAEPMNYLSNLSAQFICDDKGDIVPMEQSCCYQFTEKYQSGGAGLISTTMDYAKFADTIACGGVNKAGKRIIKARTIETIKENLLGEESLKDIEITMGRKGYGYGIGMQVLMDPVILKSKAPAGVFGWDGAAGSCIIMDTKSKTSLVYTMHVRNCGMAYGEVHPRLREFLFE
ncbi:MAG: beta-lactamase family protein [Lachnospiraceae bacterium]|nr:beta-lactamase family protein [Lachnospiraceae bacterium]